MSGLHNHARRALKNGLCVLPAAADGTKRPAVTWRNYQEHRPTPGQIDAWFTGDHYDGLGYICGEVSGGLVMFEFEGRAVTEGIYDEFLETASLAGLRFVDRIDTGYCEQSPSGGIHWLYRVTGEQVAGNLKLARRPGTQPNNVDVLIETRGEGGWTVAAPSAGRTHPTGQPWQILHGDIDTIATITAGQQAQLFELARTLDRMPDPEIGRSVDTGTVPKTERYGDDRPGDRYNRETTWAEILEPHGWTFLFERNGISYWRRPGKTEGISATTNALGTDRLKVFSSSTTFNTDTTYDKLGAHAHLNHAGNLTETVTAIADQLGMTSQPAPALTTILGDTLDPDSDLPQPINWHEFWKQDYAERDWLLEPFLVKGRAHALYAPAKTGKSLFTLQAVVALALGKPHLHQHATDPINVVYFDYEMGEEDLYQRLTGMGIEDTIFERLHYYPFPAIEPLDTKEGGRKMLRVAKKHDAKFVIVDTVARAVEGDENEADTIRKLANHTGVLLKRHKITGLRIDHGGKDITKGQRGTSAKNDDVDIVWQLTGTGDRFTLKCTHQRVGYVPQQVELIRTQDPLGYQITTYQWPAGTKELADHLERLGAPVDEGARKIRGRIKEWNADHENDVIAASNDTLAAAIKWRKIGRPSLAEMTADTSTDTFSSTERSAA